MKVFAINGSPRKGHNTDKLLRAFLEGATSANPNAEVKLINLYDLNFKGCTECFACKVKGSANYGKCCYRDDITELLWEASNTDVIAFGSPVYFSDITGQLRCFLERLLYPHTAFKKDSERVIAPKKVRTAFFHTMNIKKEMADMAGYEQRMAGTHFWLNHVFGYSPEVLYAYNIFQLEDYERYEFDIWDWKEKAMWRDTQFKIDLQKAFEIGRKLTEQCE